MKTFYILHQVRKVDRAFRTPEALVAAAFGPINDDLGPEHPANKNRIKAVERLKEMPESPNFLSFGIAGQVWRARCNESDLDAPPENTQEA